MKLTLSLLCIKILFLILTDAVPVKVVPGERTVVKKDGATHTISKYYVVPNDFETNQPTNNKTSITATDIQKEHRYSKSIDSSLEFEERVGQPSDSEDEDNSNGYEGLHLVIKPSASGVKAKFYEKADDDEEDSESSILYNTLRTPEPDSLSSLQVEPITITNNINNIVSNETKVSEKDNNTTSENKFILSSPQIETESNLEDDNDTILREFLNGAHKTSSRNLEDFWLLTKAYADVAQSEDEVWLKLEHISPLLSIYTTLYQDLKANIPIESKIDRISAILSGSDDTPLEPTRSANIPENSKEECLRKCEEQDKSEPDSQELAVSEDNNRTADDDVELNDGTVNVNELHSTSAPNSNQTIGDKQPIQIQTSQLTIPNGINTVKHLKGVPDGFNVLTTLTDPQQNNIARLNDDHDWVDTTPNPTEKSQESSKELSLNHKDLPAKIDEASVEKLISQILDTEQPSQFDESAIKMVPKKKEDTGIPKLLTKLDEKKNEWEQPQTIEEHLPYKIQNIEYDESSPWGTEIQRNENPGLGEKDKEVVQPVWNVEYTEDIKPQWSSDERRGIEPPEWNIADGQPRWAIEDRGTVKPEWKKYEKLVEPTDWYIDESDKGAERPRWTIQDRGTVKPGWNIDEKLVEPSEWFIEDRGTVKPGWNIDEKLVEPSEWYIEDRGTVKPEWSIKDKPRWSENQREVEPPEWHIEDEDVVKPVWTKNKEADIPGWGEKHQGMEPPEWYKKDKEPEKLQWTEKQGTDEPEWVEKHQGIKHPEWHIEDEEPVKLRWIEKKGPDRPEWVKKHRGIKPPEWHIEDEEPVKLQWTENKWTEKPRWSIKHQEIEPPKWYIEDNEPEKLQWVEKIGTEKPDWSEKHRMIEPPEWHIKDKEPVKLQWSEDKRTEKPEWSEEYRGIQPPEWHIDDEVPVKLQWIKDNWVEKPEWGETHPGIEPPEWHVEGYDPAKQQRTADKWPESSRWSETHQEVEPTEWHIADIDAPKWTDDKKDESPQGAKEKENEEDPQWSEDRQAKAPQWDENEQRIEPLQWNIDDNNRLPWTIQDRSVLKSFIPHYLTVKKRQGKPHIYTYVINPTAFLKQKPAEESMVKVQSGNYHNNLAGLENSYSLSSPVEKNKVTVIKQNPSIYTIESSGHNIGSRVPSISQSNYLLGLENSINRPGLQMNSLQSGAVYRPTAHQVSSSAESVVYKPVNPYGIHHNVVKHKTTTTVDDSNGRPNLLQDTRPNYYGNAKYNSPAISNPFLQANPLTQYVGLNQANNLPIPGYNGGKVIFHHQPYSHKVHVFSQPSVLTYLYNNRPGLSYNGQWKSNLAPTYQLFSLKNLQKLHDALTHAKQRNGLKVKDYVELINLKKIINILLILANHYGDNDGSYRWYENVFQNANINKHPLQLYVYNLLRQKWLHELLYILENNNYNLNILNNPSLLSILGSWQFPIYVLTFLKEDNSLTDNSNAQINFPMTYDTHNFLQTKVGSPETTANSYETADGIQHYITKQVEDNYQSPNETIVLSITGVKSELDANAIVEILKKYLYYKNYIENEENVQTLDKKVEMLKHIVVYLKNKGYSTDTIADLIHKLYGAVHSVEGKGCPKQYSDFARNMHDVIVPVLRRSGQ